MKLYYKILFVISIIFLCIFIISVLISINILINNQTRNISLFKNEFINSYTEYSESSAKIFFKNFDTRIKDNSTGSLTAIISDLKKENEDSVVIFDVEGRELFSSPNYEKIINYIMTKESFNQLLKNSLIQEKKEFRIDNFKSFFSEKYSFITPSIIHFKIYENLNAVVGNVKTSNATSVRIRFLERMNQNEIKNYLTIYIVIFLIFLSASFFVLLFILKKTIINPIAVLSGFFQKIINGNYSQRIKIESKDEIGELGISFNFMSDKIEGTLTELKKEIAFRKNAERLVEEEKEELSVTLKSIGDGVITTGIDGKIVLMNNIAEILTGWTQEDARGKDLGEVFILANEKSNSKVINPVVKALEEGKIIDLGSHVLLISKNGKKILIDDSAAPIFYNEKIIGAVLVFRDITEKQKMEENYFKAVKLESIGILAGGIAHDFNNILTAVLGNISLVKEFVKKDKELLEIISEAEKASFRARDLSNQLLSLSKGGSPVISSSSIKDLLKEGADFILHGTKIKCEYVIPLDVWNVKCDESQIVQVIHNLVINARQAMYEGGKIVISCENIQIDENEKKSSLAQGKYVKIRIKDTGAGISKENLFKIFDPYFTTKKDGQGIGLTTAYSIIRKHKGFIEVESEINVGTSFIFYLPASFDDISSKEEEKKILEMTNLKILVLEDDENIIKFLNIFCQSKKHFLKVTLDGIETVAEFKNAVELAVKYDLVILDLTIPNGMGGKETIKLLKEIDPDVKAVVSSGYSNDAVLANYKDYGFTSSLIKPYTVEDFNKVLIEVFKN